MLLRRHVCEVGKAVVERSVVFVMAILAVWGLCNDSVHANRYALAVYDSPANRVVAAAALDGPPVVAIQVLKKVGVNYCEHPLRQGDSAAGPDFGDVDFFDEHFLGVSQCPSVEVIATQPILVRFF